MPGLIFEADADRITGWAWHKEAPAYNILLHLIYGTTIVHSVIADKPGPESADAEALGHWFEIDFTVPGIDTPVPATVGLLIGETDEFMNPFPHAPSRSRPISIEEILDARFQRPWVTGKIYTDAEKAGLSVETIVDMFYRDYLHRPVDPLGLRDYAGGIRDGSITYERLRHDLLGSDEYRFNKRRIHEAPGCIFSQMIVINAKEFSGPAEQSRLDNEVSAAKLLALEAPAFVEAAFLRVLGRSCDAESRDHYLRELSIGRDRLDIIFAFAAEMEATARNVVIMDIPGADGAAGRPLCLAPKLDSEAHTLPGLIGRTGRMPSGRMADSETARQGWRFRSP